MFNAFYKLKNVPFTKSTPPASLFPHKNLLELHERCKFCVLNDKFAVITGICGTGKTTAIRRFVSSLNKSKYIVLYIADSSLNPRCFYRTMLSQLGIQARRSKNEAKQQLQEQLFLLKHAKGITPVCIIDEGHTLSYEMIEELRFVLNMQFDSINPLSLILCGQPELRMKLKSSKCEAVEQRIDINYHLLPFDLDSTSKYIKHQLKYAGATHDIFTEESISIIHASSSGIARKIDKICTSCLFYGEQKKISVIDGNIVKEIVELEFA